MSFEIAPNASLQQYSLPSDLSVQSKTSFGIERFMSGVNATNGVMTWAGWGSGYTAPTTWYISPSNDYSGGVNYGNHQFEYFAFASDINRIYTTGQGRIVNTTYPTNKISYANFSDLRPSESVFGNIAFSKCLGDFPTAIRPTDIACTADSTKIMVVGVDGITPHVMASNTSGNSWFSIPLPGSLAVWTGGWQMECDNEYFYLLTVSSLWKISVNFTASSGISDWTEIDFSTSSSKPNYVSGYSNLRIFNLDTYNSRLYIFSYTNSNSTEGNGSGVFVSTDTINWTLVRFNASISPLRYVSYISDISFANRLGNKIVVTANFDQWNDDNRRYIIYTSDLTGKTGWTMVEPTGNDRRNYYDLISTCITPDNRYFVFDRLGSVYYTSDLSGTFTKVATNSANPPYDNRMYYVDGSQYIKYTYGNAAYNLPDVNTLDTNYAYDSYKDGDSYESRKWTKQNITVTSNDDGYSNEPINIGFNWNYNGSTYTSFRLNTNGQLHFSNFGGDIYTGEGDRIIAQYGDLWYSTGVTNSTNPAPIGETIASVITVTPVVLKSQYKITATTNGSYIDFALDPTADEQYAKYIIIDGYTNTSGGYVTQRVEGLLDFEGLRADFNGTPLSQISSFNISYINSYFHFWNAYYPNSGITRLINNTNHGVYTKNISWVDNGVQHNIFRLAVNCGRYGFVGKEHGYRVSLYKSGASQKISISALSPFSCFRYAKSTVNGKNIGPYPFATSNFALKASLDYYETTWYSDDNGATWYLNSKDGTNKSTVVQMGPSQGISNNISLNKTKIYLSSSRTNLYSETDAWNTDLRSTTFGYPESASIKIGPTMHLMLLRYIVGDTNGTTYENQLFTIFNTQYSTTSNKNTYYYKYGDIDRSQSINTSDAIDMQRISLGLEPYGAYSATGAAILVQYILSNYSNDFITAAYNAGWISPNTVEMNSFFSSGVMLPGIKNLTVSRSSNIRSSDLLELGPVYRMNVYDKILTPAPSWKPTYATAASSRGFKV